MTLGGEKNKDFCNKNDGSNKNQDGDQEPPNKRRKITQNKSNNAG